MNYIFKSFFLIYITSRFAIYGKAAFLDIALILLVTAGNIYREKFRDSIVVQALEILLITWATTWDPSYACLLGIEAYDLVGKKFYWGVLPICIVGLFYLPVGQYINFLFLLTLCCYFAFIRRRLQEKEEKYRHSYDKEREYSYQLETAKIKLLQSSIEVAHLAEIKERNRIAREIHDNVGHSIAGILLQLQASLKLQGKKDEKARELLDSSIVTLSHTLVTLRDTVHNIKPRESLGVEYIKGTIDSFGFCPTEFSYEGDFGSISPIHMEILSTNIKEALTNASKYSKATKINIRIDIYEHFVRLYIKDNGIGCKIIKEGLGLSGMCERTKNVGGSLSMSSEEGFLIVCILPQLISEGSLKHEGFDS